MRHNITATVFVCLCLSYAAFGQTAILKGRAADDREKPVPNARIITPDGQADTTDSKGQFTIAFPATVQPGQATRIELRDKPDWVIYEPMLGYCVTQNAKRNFEPLNVIIVQKGSPLALSPKRLSQVIARWANERVQLRSQVKEQQSQLDEYAFLRDYAERYGFTLEQFREAADQWANSKIAADKLEAGWQEYWKKNYDRAAQLGSESRVTFKEKLKRDKERRLEDGRQFIRSAKLEGDARYANDKFREAIAAYQEIEIGFKERSLIQEDFPKEWATNKVSLGDSKTSLGIRGEVKESRLLLAEAVADYRDAFRVYTREQLPEDWARTQAQLAFVLTKRSEMGESDAIRLLAEAIAACREALTFFTREQSPEGWALTQNNLGLALRGKAYRTSGAEGMQLLSEAIIAHREALKVYNNTDWPWSWAAAHNRMGIALSDQGQRTKGLEGLRLLTEASAAYREALKVWTHEKFPEDWARAQYNLGAALSEQGERTNGAERLRLLTEATAAYREALKVYTREPLSLQHAMAQHNLGGVLREQGEQVSGVEGLQLLTEATEAYREALKVYTRELSPHDWVAAQHELGLALSEQGERMSGAEGIRLLTEANTAYREALKVWTHEKFPEHWASTQYNLGLVLSEQGKRMTGVEGLRLLTEASTVFREALKVWTHEKFPEDWVRAQYNLGAVLSEQSERTNGTEKNHLLIEAIVSFEKILVLDSSDEESYRSLASIYHEQLFEYAKAFALHKQWLSRFPQDIDTLLDFAENHFTTGRFAEFSARLKPLLAHPELAAATKVALQMIEVANLLALDQAAQVPDALSNLRKTIEAQPAEFRLTWSFTGTLHFIQQEGKLAAHRAWLEQLFAIAQGAERDAILKALRAAQEQFRPGAR